MPIFFVQGLTDPLFPATEALQIRNLVKADDPSYPIKVFLGDFGHDYTGQRQDEWDLAHAQMSEFVDHYLRPDRTPVISDVRRRLDRHPLPRPRRADALRERADVGRASPRSTSRSRAPTRAQRL